MYLVLQDVLGTGTVDTVDEDFGAHDERYWNERGKKRNNEKQFYVIKVNNNCYMNIAIE